MKMKKKILLLFFVAILGILSGCLPPEVRPLEGDRPELSAPAPTEKTITEEVEASIDPENTAPEPIEVTPENADTDGTVVTPEDEQPLPLVTIQDIWEKFEIRVVGEIWDRASIFRGKKIGDHQPTVDELLLVYNVLSSLPQNILEGLKGLESITILYRPTSGVGGLYFQKRIVIIGTPDRPGAVSSARGAFITALYHEIGHYVGDSMLSLDEWTRFSLFHYISQNKEDFADCYGMNNPCEDFATLFEAYFSDTEALLERASKSQLLREKLNFVSRLFPDDWRYKVERNGAITRFEGEKKMVWPYRSRTNPSIEDMIKRHFG